MSKKIISIIVINLLLMTSMVSVNAYDMMEESEELNYIHITDISIDDDAKSTTGPMPPIECGVDIDTSQLMNQIIIEDVPSYIWHHGCGPTAAGMVIGYWDGQGFDDLIEGSASTQTEAVNNTIASQENYEDYCIPIDYWPNLLPDKSEPPFGDEHDDNCLADFMKTSQSYYWNFYGWSYYDKVKDALLEYINYVNPQYEVSVNNLSWDDLSWDIYCDEIDTGRPVVFLVDTDGNNNTDHFITAIGYDENYHYACYNTWDHDVHWYEFSGMAPGQPWGIYGGTFCSLIYDPPESEMDITGVAGGFGKVYAEINNIAEEDIVNLSWNITIKGGMFSRINTTTKNKTFKVMANTALDICTEKFIFGFGKIQINITAKADNAPKVTKEAKGFVILFIILIL